MNPYSTQAPFIAQSNPGGNAFNIVFTIVIPVLWFIALLLPAFSTNDHSSNELMGMGKIYGGQCLVWGSSMASSSYIVYLAWSANFPFFAAYFMFAAYRSKQVLLAAVITSALAMLFSFGALAADSFSKNSSASALISSSASNMLSPSIGCYVWILAIALTLVASVVKFVTVSRMERIQPVFIPPYYSPQPPPFPPTHPQG